MKCFKCKGRGFCGRTFCPIYSKAESMFKAVNLIDKEDFFANSPPSVFVGRIGYPDVNVGVLSPGMFKENVSQYDDPHYWFENDTSIQDIVNFRSSLINSRFKTKVKNPAGKFVEMSQDIAMASKPAEIEVELKHKPKARVNLNSITMPMGPTVDLEKLKITSNPNTDTRVEKVVYDYDMKSVEGLNTLYKKGFNENILSKLLSIGVFGVKKNRRLVPTRWSLTSVDSIIGNNLVSEIKKNNVADYSVYFDGYFGNYFLILFFPEIYSYELFEMYMPEAMWNPEKKLNYTTDYESYNGRKSYAENCGGGFYACRLGVTEKLKEIKRQASVLVLRFITNEYTCPLGVFVVRQATRKSLMNKPQSFESKELMLAYVKSFVKKKFGQDISGILNKSILLKNIKQQSKLTKFL